MTRKKAAPVPVFTPWDGDAMELRHHEDRQYVGRIITADAGKWLLEWHENRVLPSIHESAQHAVARATEQYPVFLQAQADFYREEEERAAYEERFVRRRAGEVARALRIPTGGQRGWKDQPKPPSA